MDYNTKVKNGSQRQFDLLDFLPESSVDVPGGPRNVERMKGLPTEKSKNSGHFNSDVIAVKSRSGDTAFVAVGRPASQKPKAQLNSPPHVIHKQRKNCSTENRKNSQTNTLSHPSNNGRDNFNNAKNFSTNGDGCKCSSHLKRWINKEFQNSDQMHAADQSHSLVFCENGAYPISSRNVLHTSQGQSSSRKHSGSKFQASVETEITKADSETESRDLEPVSSVPPCKTCGQCHGATENHEYDYVDEVDEDLMCDICLQPLVDPYDTKCGHTFCSICIKNYLRAQKICPVDRKELSNSSEDRWQSSLVMRKLVNKLLVTCPHEKYCKKTVQRCDLKDHLQDVCPGSVVKCPKAMYGCLHKTPRVKLERHLEKCEFKDFTGKLSDLHPFSEDVTVELFRPEGTAELGITIIGGCDTPLVDVMIQDVLKDGLAGQDGRLQPGDVIVEVNSESLVSVTHAEARAALSKPSNIMRFALLRCVKISEVANDSTKPVTHGKSPLSRNNEEHVCLSKPPSKQLGIRLASGDDDKKGVYVLKLFPGHVAQLDGRLRVGDRIMKIGGTDLSHSTPEEAASVISKCGSEINIVVRHTRENSSKSANRYADGSTPSGGNHPEGRYLNPESQKPLKKSSHTRKIISVTKSPTENLGIMVSGGKGSPAGNIPIFVQCIVPSSVLGEDSRMKRGDLLFEINATRLTGLTQRQAMSVLRDSAQQNEVTIVAFEFDYKGKEEEERLWDEMMSLHQDSKWMPSWKMWLSVTKKFSYLQEVVLSKSTVGNYGCKVSQSTKDSGSLLIFITEISQSSPASKHLKCGDEIVAINKRPVKDLPYLQILNLLRTTKSISLIIVSWPGSMH